MQVYTIGELESLLIALSVLILGHLVNRKVAIFRHFNIPEPIVGGLLIAAIITLLFTQGIVFEFSLSMQKPLMLMFFATVGLAANYRLLLKGGRRVIIFLLLASIYIILQNTVGVGLAALMGFDALLGLVAGSISLSGGHGTGAAWASIFSEQYGISTLEVAMASATFGLVMGGVIGGPVAQRLIDKHQLKSEYGNSHHQHLEHPDLVTYDNLEEDRVTAKRIIETLFILLLCVVGAKLIDYSVGYYQIKWLKMPDFVYALFIGVFLTNLTEITRGYKINSECVDILGTVALSLFLAMALMSLRLWEIFSLALPLLVILTVQTLVLAVFAYFVTFRVMGANYDAAVIAGGHCGFGMGATPTAVMNMGALVSRNGPSPQAFMVVPIVGAFFIDITNLIVLQGFIGFLMP
ncbi:sodium/glutamate symporter [Thaumasiovibrio sp. DFM-14]|uniref:sodium/glutamate symporter n=1 Tax=Thaumasiovibrio sp. DFM-14 TaxID=3384792 RepID=UPI0039A2C065